MCVCCMCMCVCVVRLCVCVCVCVCVCMCMLCAAQEGPSARGTHLLALQLLGRRRADEGVRRAATRSAQVIQDRRGVL
jgi:hypothetical protein